MKIIVNIYLICLLISTITAKEYSDVNIRKHEKFAPTAIIQQLFEMLRSVIKNGLPDKDIPPADPYVFQYTMLNFTRDHLRIEANISNGNIVGFGDYQILRSDFLKQDICIDLDVKFPLLKLEAEYYEMNGSVLDDLLPLSGIGILNFAVEDFKFTSKVYLKQSEDEKSILIHKFENPQFSIQRVLSRTQFDDNIDEIFNAMIEDLMAGYLTRFSKYLAVTYGDYVIDLINSYLANFDSWRLLALIL